MGSVSQLQNRVATSSNPRPVSDFERIFGGGSQLQAPIGQAGAVVTDLGSIARLELPPSWKAGRNVAPGDSYVREFHPDGHDSTQIVVSYRGQTLSHKATEHFRKILAGAPANGTAKSIFKKELASLEVEELLQEYGAPTEFTIGTAAVQLLNNMPVLTIEGQYINYDVKAKVMFVDSNFPSQTAVPSAVQQITYIAPSADYFKFSAQVRQTLTAILWRV